MKKENNRIIWLDLARIFAALAVVLIHVTLRSYNVQPFSAAWGIIDFYQLFPRWAVPVFLMISGTFFLHPKKDISSKTIYTHYLPRILFIYLAWSFFYTLLLWSLNYIQHAVKPWDWYLAHFLQGHYHLWFFSVLAVLYALTPLLRKWIFILSAKQYAAVLGACLLTAVFWLRFTQADWQWKRLFPFTCGYLVYFLAGHFFASFSLSAKVKWTVYGAGMLSFLGAVFVSCKLALENRFVVVLPPLALPTFFISASVFLFLQNNLQSLTWATRTQEHIIYAGRLTLGVYLIHPLILAVFEHLGWFSGRYLGAEAAFWIPMQTGLIAGLSFVLIAFLYHFPLVRKYLL